MNDKEILTKNRKWRNIFINLLMTGGIILMFLLSIDLLVEGLQYFGGDTAQSILKITSNPFIGLFIGILATALVQSSSMTISMMVAMVASGAIELTNAIPIVMGANIGTTLTSNIVSLSFITRKKEFRRAISTSTSHAFFNILVTIILFPLEYKFGLLSGLATEITSNFSDVYDTNASNQLMASHSATPFGHWLAGFIDNYTVILILAVLMLFGSIKLFSRKIYQLLIDSKRNQYESFVFSSTLRAFSWGTILTGAVQSSSVTTSLVVPVVAIGKVNLKRAFPYILGANIGTTITAFLASLFKTDAAISLAFVHLLFNAIGVFIFLPFPFMRRLPVFLAGELGKATLQNRLIGFIYIILTFFLIPFILITISR